jgi:outer membrane receptor protein involved in Fe transport
MNVSFPRLCARVVRHAAVAACLVLGAPAIAFAQDEVSAADAPQEEIIVTGTRIKGNPDVASSNPITVVGPIELERSDTISIQNVLAKLPSVGTQGLNSQESSNFGGNGFQNIDLRNLQPQRTLVLVDGERFVSSANAGAFSAVDLNNIPIDLIDHIEILRDGASPVYGSDALAGVVNFVLKKKFDGIQVSSQVGTSGHADGTEYSVSTLMGVSNDRGSVMLDLGYNHVDPVYQRSRAFAANIDGSGVSGYFPQGHFYDDATDGDVVNLLGNNHGGFTPYNGSKFDTTKIPNLISGYERKTANAIGSYDLNPDSTDFPIKLVGSFMFTDRSSLGVANPDPQFAQSTTVGGYEGQLIDVAFRSPEIGDRIYVTNVQTYRLVVGLEGQLFGKYDWEFKYNNGVSTGQQETQNLVNENVLCPPATPTSPVGCIYTGGDLNNLTPAQIASLRLSPTENLRTEQDVWSGQVSGPLFTLPAGDVSFAVGGDYRSESLVDQPDSAEVLGYVDQGGNQLQSL